MQWCALVFLACVGCASTTPNLDEPFEPLNTEQAPRSDPAAALASNPEPPAHCEVAARTLQRGDVERFVAAGLGSVLTRVELDAQLDRGHFVGFRIVRSPDLERWRCAGVPLSVGDVVTRLNGMPIARPEQAAWAFEHTRIVNALTIDYVRAGVNGTIVVPIEGTRAAAP